MSCYKERNSDSASDAPQLLSCLWYDVVVRSRGSIFLLLLLHRDRPEDVHESLNLEGILRVRVL